MSALALGLACAVAASVALNAGFVLQHLGAMTTEPVSALHPLRALRQLLSARTWAAGTVLGFLGWGLHVTALTRAPLSLVQAFVAGGLILTVPLARVWSPVRPGARDLAAAAVLAAGLAALGLGLSSAAAPAVSTTWLGLFVGATAALAAVVCLGTGSALRPVALACGSGLLYGAADMTMKMATTAAHTSVVAAVPWAIAVAALSTGAFFPFQRSLQTGAPVATIGAMTAATYVLSIAGGLVIFGDVLGTTPILAVLHACALLAVVGAASMLAGSQARLIAVGEAA